MLAGIDSRPPATRYEGQGLEEHSLTDRQNGCRVRAFFFDDSRDHNCRWQTSSSKRPFAEVFGIRLQNAIGPWPMRHPENPGGGVSLKHVKQANKLL